MAYSKETWERAKGLFLIGKSLSEIADECDIKDRTSILRRAKKEEWEKGKNQQLKTDIREFEQEKSTLDAKKSTLVEKIASLEDYEVQILDEVIQKEEGIESLLFSNAILGGIRINQAFKRNTKQVMVKEVEYSEEGKQTKATMTPSDIELSPSDYKELLEANDKASITTRVNQRHAKTEINNTNAQQHNEPTQIIIKRED